MCIGCHCLESLIGMDELHQLVHEFGYSAKWFELYQQIRVSPYKGMAGQFGRTGLLVFVMAGRIVLTFQRPDGHVNLITTSRHPTIVQLRNDPMDIALAIAAIQEVLDVDGTLEPRRDVSLFLPW